MNPVYEPNSKVIWPSVAPASLRLWSGLFLRWVVDQSPTTDTWLAISEMREKEKELKRQAIRLRRQLIEMEKVLTKNLSVDTAEAEDAVFETENAGLKPSSSTQSHSEEGT